jgi:hypothetical protein
MASELGLTQSAVHRIWRAFGLQPRPARSSAVCTPVTARLSSRSSYGPLDGEVPADLDVHVILDNTSTHKTPAIRNWLTAHPGFVWHFTPTSSSWLNPVERWFAEQTTKKPRRGAPVAVPGRGTAIVSKRRPMASESSLAPNPD